MDRHFASLSTIARKDLRVLWPLALTVALAQLVVPAFFPDGDTYRSLSLDLFGSPILVNMVLFFQLALQAAIVIFIVLLIQQDAVADLHRDWMTRPIAPMDMMVAKAGLVLAIVLIPSIIGNAIHVIFAGKSPNEIVLGATLTLHLCVFVLLVSWLSSSPIQAVLAMAAAAVTFVLMIFLTFEGGMSKSVAIAVQEPVAVNGFARLPPEAVRVAGDGLPSLAYGLLWLEIPLLVAASAGILWLVLARRKLLVARLALVGLMFAQLLFLFAFMQPEFVEVERAVPMEAPQSAPFRRQGTPAPIGPRTQRINPPTLCVGPQCPEAAPAPAPEAPPLPAPTFESQSSRRIPESVPAPSTRPPEPVLPAPAQPAASAGRTSTMITNAKGTA